MGRRHIAFFSAYDRDMDTFPIETEDRYDMFIIK
jgi:hypothetical protein